MGNFVITLIQQNIKIVEIEEIPQPLTHKYMTAHIPGLEETQTVPYMYLNKYYYYYYYYYSEEIEDTNGVILMNP